MSKKQEPLEFYNLTRDELAEFKRRMEKLGMVKWSFASALLCLITLEKLGVVGRVKCSEGKLWIPYVSGSGAAKRLKAVVTTGHSLPRGYERIAQPYLYATEIAQDEAYREECRREWRREKKRETNARRRAGARSLYDPEPTTGSD